MIILNNLVLNLIKNILESIMLSKQELIEEVLLLPIEDRAYIIDSLIQSMNPIDSDIDRKWLEVSKKRLNELKSGEVKGVPGDEVFNKIWKRFEK